MSTFAATYGDNPWADVTDKTREIFLPDLLDVFRQNPFFQQFVPFRVDLGARNAQTMTFTTMYDLEPITDAIGLRDIWLDTQGTDSEQKSVTLEHHAGKVTLHKFDDMINQWRRPGAAGLAGLRGIVRNLLATSMVEHLDILARNALLSGSYHMYGTNQDGSNFSSLDETELYDPSVSDDIFLGMQMRGYSGAVGVSNDGQGQSIIALTTPGNIHQIQKNADWKSTTQYGSPARLLRYEVGSYRNVRYLSSNKLVLWNCGPITVQSAIKDPLYRGAGADRNVDSNRVVGQATLANGNRYIQLDADDLSGINVGDNITIHTQRTSDFGVTNGVDYRVGTNSERRVVSVDNGTKRITVDRPILKDAYTTDLGGSVYGYVTKALNVHPTVFLTGPNAVVSGVAQPPMTHVPPIVDDVGGFFRFSWDAYLKYQIWNDHNVEVNFNAAQYRLKGNARF